MSYDRLLAELDCMTPGQAALFNQPETETYTGRAAAAIRALRAELALKDMDTRDMDAYDDRWFALHTQLDEARDAIDRVRELCDETDGPSTVRKDVILAAIEGNQP